MQTRPYEKNKGDSDNAYHRALNRLIQTVERQGTVGDCGRFAADLFASLSVNKKESKPLIGIVGEIFVRSNQFSNNFIVSTVALSCYTRTLVLFLLNNPTPLALLPSRLSRRIPGIMLRNGA